MNALGFLPAKGHGFLPTKGLGLLPIGGLVFLLCSSDKPIVLFPIYRHLVATIQTKSTKKKKEVPLCINIDRIFIGGHEFRLHRLPRHHHHRVLQIEKLDLASLVYKGVKTCGAFALAGYCFATVSKFKPLAILFSCFIVTTVSIKLWN